MSVKSSSPQAKECGLTWANALIARPLPEPSTYHLPPADGNGDTSLPELEVPAESTSPIDDSVASPFTEPEETSHPIHINGADVLAASDLDTLTTQASLCDSATIPPATAIVQKAQSTTAQTAEACDTSFASPPPIPRSSLQSTPLPSLPPSPADTVPHAPTRLDTLIDPSPFCSCTEASRMQAGDSAELLRHRETSYLLMHIVTETLSALATTVCRISRDGPLWLNIHRLLQTVNQEHLCIDSLREQFLLIKRLATVSNLSIGIIEKNTAELQLPMDAALQCQQDMHSIVLDAERSMTVIAKLLAHAGHTVFIPLQMHGAT